MSAPLRLAPFADAAEPLRSLPLAIPIAPETVPVAPGVHWLRMPLPFAGLDHINLWLMDDGHGITIVDTGVHCPMAHEIWRAVLEGPFLAGKPVHRILVTHFHPDHMGNAGWLAERTDAPLLTSRIEWLTGRMLQLDEHWLGEPAAEDFYRTAGLDPTLATELLGRGNRYRSICGAIPARFERLQEGQLIKLAGDMFHVMIGRGHAPEHICLYSPVRKLLIGGDQVLPKITANLSVMPIEPDADPVADYIDSLNQFLDLPEDVLVLPSHGRPYVGLQPRIQQIHDHHAERLQLVLRLCATPQNAAAVMAQMFNRALDAHQASFAIGEAVAHLNHLCRANLVERQQLADGHFLYQTRSL